MEWVALDVHIAGNAVTHRLAEQFKLRVAEAAGLLALTFAGMAEHAPGGQLADVPNSQIEAWAHWHGKRGRFAAFFREQMCDEAGEVVEWERWNGANMRAADASRRRSKAWRDLRRQEREAREAAQLEAAERALQTTNGTSAQPSVGTRDERRSLQGSERVANATTGQDKTRHDTVLKPPHARDGDAVMEAEPSVAMVELKLQASEHWGEIESWLKHRSPAARDEWAKDLLALIGPATGNLAEDLARACRDGHLAEPPVTNARTLRIFVASCRNDRLAIARAVGGRPVTNGALTAKASELWTRYRQAGLVAPRISAEMLRERGDQLVVAGHYPDFDTFRAEVMLTRPWEFADIRSDGWAINEIAKRLAVPVKVSA